MDFNIHHLKSVAPTSSKHYRLISSQFPPINFFEQLVEPRLMDALFALESLTNERLKEQVGDLHRIALEDRVSGSGASVVMAAFTHIGQASRFTDGSFGVYYAADSLKCAVAETCYHRERFLRYTQEHPCTIHMRCYVNSVVKPLIDIRSPDYQSLYHDSDYTPSQQFAQSLRQALNPYGLVYNSVRFEKGHCIAIFRPNALTLPVQSKHFGYVYNGDRIEHIYEMTELSLN